MKKIILILALLALAAGAMWFANHAPIKAMPVTENHPLLYYTCAMHSHIRADKPGPCPVCGMKLTPVYAHEHGDAETNAAPGTITLASAQLNVINVQSAVVQRQPLRRTLHFGGTIQRNSWSAAWFVFDAYESDLPWLKVDQTLRVILTATPEKSYDAQIKLRGTQAFADRNFDEMSGSTKVRAEILHPPVEVGDFGGALFNNLHAEGHLVASTPEVLTVPRSAVISRGIGPLVYVEKSSGYYVPRALRLGRAGDDFYEVLAGLEAGEKVVTTGNVLIDSEAQLTAAQ